MDFGKRWLFIVWIFSFFSSSAITFCLSRHWRHKSHVNKHTNWQNSCLMRSGNFEITHRVQLLQDALGKAIIISKEATHRIEELQVQLSIVQRQCTTRDRPLCDTLRLRGFDDNGILNTLTKVRLITACTCIQLTIAPSLLICQPKKLRY